MHSHWDRPGTWDPLLPCCKACTWTHLSWSYKIQRNYMGLKITAYMPSGGKFWTQKIQKAKKTKQNKTKPNCHFCSARSKNLVLGAIARYCACPPVQPPRHAPTLPLIRNELAPPPRGSEQGSLSLVLAASCSQFRDPSEALPEFLVWPLVSFYGLGKAKDPGRYQNSPKILRKKL